MSVFASSYIERRSCPCGSGKFWHELYDARGIYVAKVCADCEAKVRVKYRPEIFTDSMYEADEPIEGDDWV